MGRINTAKRGGNSKLKSAVRLVLGVAVGILILCAVGFTDLAINGALSPGHQPVADIPQLVVTSEMLTVAIVPLVPSPEIAGSIPGEEFEAAVAAKQLISEEGLKELAAGLTEIYGFDVEVLEPLVIPDEYYNSSRAQYRIDDMVDWLMERTNPRHFKTIGVTAQDVYKPEFNFLFGLARIAGSTCVASSNRMPGDVLFPKLTPGERWCSLAAHELGHTLGLIHIENKNSIMQYGDSLDALDRTGTNLVDDDRRRLEQLWPVDWGWN